MKIQTPTETTCWDGGEHKWAESGISGRFVDTAKQLFWCLRCGCLDSEMHSGIAIPTMFEALSQGKDETDAD